MNKSTVNGGIDNSSKILRIWCPISNPNSESPQWLPNFLFCGNMWCPLSGKYILWAVDLMSMLATTIIYSFHFWFWMRWGGWTNTDKGFFPSFFHQAFFIYHFLSNLKGEQYCKKYRVSNKKLTKNVYKWALLMKVYWLHVILFAIKFSSSISC